MGEPVEAGTEISCISADLQFFNIVWNYGTRIERWDFIRG